MADWTRIEDVVETEPTNVRVGSDPLNAGNLANLCDLKLRT